MNPVAQSLSALHTGAPQTFRNMTCVPLFAAGEREPEYLTLDEALGRGRAHAPSERSRGIRH